MDSGSPVMHAASSENKQLVIQEYFAMVGAQQVIFDISGSTNRKIIDNHHRLQPLNTHTGTMEPLEV